MTDQNNVISAHEQAKNFRIILDATSHPGRIVKLLAGPSVAEPMSGEASTLILTLCDFQTPIWLCPNLRNAKTEKYINFHTGAALTTDRASASFAVADVAQPLPRIAEFALGDHEYPDRSTTLIVTTNGLDNETGVELLGPGIQGSTVLNAAGASRDFWEDMISSRGLFPRGVDVIFTAPGKLAVIPRSTQIKFRDQH